MTVDDESAGDDCDDIFHDISDRVVGDVSGSSTFVGRSSSSLYTTTDTTSECASFANRQLHIIFAVGFEEVCKKHN